MKPCEIDLLSPVTLPARYNYIGVFLTLSCNLKCSYCINRHGELERSTGLLSAAEWLSGLNRLQTRTDLPITLQGGEPSLHPGFYEIMNGLRPDLPVDLLTNLQFDIDVFMKNIHPDRVKRDAPYASIRVSYHPESMDLGVLKDKTLRLLEKGYSVGIWAVDHPDYSQALRDAGDECQAAGIDFRLKEFLGEYQGKLSGTYSYDGALNRRPAGTVQCRTTELLVGPDGSLYRCHSDLYAGREAYGSLLDPELVVEDIYRPCDFYGFCNPCDVKTKTNRFQDYGHTSVDIRFQENEGSMEAGRV